MGLQRIPVVLFAVFLINGLNIIHHATTTSLQRNNSSSTTNFSTTTTNFSTTTTATTTNGTDHASTHFLEQYKELSSLIVVIGFVPGLVFAYLFCSYVPPWCQKIFDNY